MLVGLINPGALWKLPLPTGEPTRLGTIKANGQSASFFSDGRLLFALGGDLYVAEENGSNVRKFLSTPGSAGCPHVSPDGKWILLATVHAGEAYQDISEVKADGSGLHELVRGTADADTSCASWIHYGDHIVYRMVRPPRSDLWTLPVGRAVFRQKSQPSQLTNGPLRYSGVVPSPDQKHIYAIGTKPRGELVRYDLNSKQFVAFLGAISAIHPTFSRNGQWVAYISYSDHTLWRSRADGTERLQLTYPPLEVSDPVISQDGKLIVFQTVFRSESYVVSIDGGAPKKIAGRTSYHGTLSPDGTSMVYSSWTSEKHDALRTANLQTGAVSNLPQSEDKISPFWIDQNILVAATQDQKKLVTFDFKSGKWSDLLLTEVLDFMPSPEGKYIYYTTGGTDPMVSRIRLADHKVEGLTSLKDLRRVAYLDSNTTQLSVAPDGSPVFTRDVGTQEIYSLTVKWP